MPGGHTGDASSSPRPPAGKPAAGDEAFVRPLREDADPPLDVEPDPCIEDPAIWDSLPAELDPEETAVPGRPRRDPSSDTRAVLRQELRRLNLERNELRDRLHGVEEENRRTRSRLRDLNERLHAAPAAGEVTRLAAELEAVRRARQLAEQEIEKNRYQLSAVSLKLEALQARLSVEEHEETPRRGPPGAPSEETARLRQANAQLREALQGARSAQGRYLHACDDLAHKLEEAEDRIRSRESELEEARRRVEKLADDLENRNRELSVAQKALADQRDDAARVAAWEREISDREAEMQEVARALAEAREEIRRLSELRPLADRAASLEAELAEAHRRHGDATKEVEDLLERLESESARNFRLAQRRIPSLQAEVSDARTQTVNWQRKVQDLERELQASQEMQRDAQARIVVLERQLTAVRARLRDTDMIRKIEEEEAERASSGRAEDLEQRLRGAENERRGMAEAIQALETQHANEIDDLSARFETLWKESADRLVALRRAEDAARRGEGRLAEAARLARLLASARTQAEREKYLEAMTRLLPRVSVPDPDDVAADDPSGA